MRVLVIGGTGLISTAIVEQLLARGHEVVTMTRGTTRPRIPTTIPNIRCDRRDAAAFAAAVTDLPVDAVIDMVAFNLEESQSAYAAFRGRVRHFIHCSTVCVYGGLLSTLPAIESEPHTPTGEYGLNKSACEAFLMGRHAEDGFPVTIIRPSHTYGEGGSIVHSLGWDTAYLSRMRQDLPVVVHGDGQSLWASAHISDVARAFVNVLGNNVAVGEAYHLTGEEWMSWNQYHATVARVLDGRYHPIFIPAHDLYAISHERGGLAFEILQWSSIFDNSKARRDLGYEYRITWEDGVRRTVRWLEEHDGIIPADTDSFPDRLIAAWTLGCDAAKLALVDTAKEAVPSE